LIVDASIILALVFREPTTPWIARVLLQHPHDRLHMSWVNIAEAGMALLKKSLPLAQSLQPALASARIKPIDLDHDVVRIASEARIRFPINFGDCFAYAHASLRAEPLLTLDADFLKTDLAEVLHPDRVP
jgi:ribonuclease VapC